MAGERGYEAQVAPQRNAGPVLTSPDAFGAGFGAALAAYSGQALQVQRQAQSEADAADAAHKLVQARSSMVTDVIALRGQAGEDGAGHAEAVGKLWESRTAGVIDGIRDGHTRRQFQQQLETQGGAFVEREAVWQAGQQAGKLFSDTEKTGAVSQSIIARDPTKYGEETLAFHSFLDTLTGLDAGSRRKVGDNYDQGAARAYLLSIDPTLAQAHLNTKDFDFLEPAQREAIQSKIGIEIRAQIAEAKTQQAIAKRDVTETVDLTIKRAGDGQQFDDEQLGALEKSAVDNGLSPAKIYEIQDMRAQNKVRIEYKGASPEVIADDLREIDAEIAKGGVNAPPALVQKRNHVATVLEQRRKEIADDQLGFAARNGIATPEIDWAAPDRAAVDARAIAVEVVAKSSGSQPQYLTKDEVAQFQGLAQQGKQGMMQALSIAKAFGDGRASAVARQIMPKDDKFAYLALLPQDAAGLAISGQWHLKTDPKAVTLDKQSRNYDDYQREFDAQDARVTDAIRSLGPQNVNTIWNTARDILAGYIAQGLGPLRPDLRWRALNEALGATGPTGAGRKGGLAMWGQRYFMRPDGMTSQEFVNRVQWTVAHGKGGGPVNPDHSAATIAKAHPVPIGANRYRFDGPDGRPLRTKAGDVFTVWTGK